MSTKFYDGTKLLSMQDLNGNKPEIYMCTTNRSGGKTTYFSRYLINRFKKRQEKFMLLYRFSYELDNCADKFFKDIKRLFFPKDEMTSQKRCKGIYHELYLNGEHCGYAISLNSADTLKKYSHFFSDVQTMFMDEFQSETAHYCNKEVEKFISIHNSVARGNGEQSRYLPVIMTANNVSILNPYYVSMGVCDRLTPETNYLRGIGWVLETSFIESASIAQKQSSFNMAFSNNKYVEYSTEKTYLNDSSAFIEKVDGRSSYIATLRYDGCDYGVREYPELGILYCDDKPDVTFKYKISITTEDHNINYVMLKRNDIFIQTLKYFFEKGCFRFKNQTCKKAILKAISYN